MTNLPESLYLDVAVKDNGKPANDGFICPPSPSVILSFIYSNPDFLISKYLPSTLTQKGNHSILIGDFKLRVSNIRGNPRQFNAILQEAKKYGTKVAFWITLQGTERQAKNVAIKAARRGVLAFVLIILGAD